MSTKPEPPPRAPRPEPIGDEVVRPSAPDLETLRPKAPRFIELSPSIFDTDQIDAVQIESTEALAAEPSSAREDSVAGVVAAAAGGEAPVDVAPEKDAPVREDAAQEALGEDESGEDVGVDDAHDGDAGTDDPPVVTVPKATSSIARRSRPPVWLTVVMALLILAVPVLGYAGFQLVDHSTRGRVLSGVSSATDPGYEALLEPTATALLIITGDDGVAESLTVLSLSGAEGHGGAVVSIPAQTRLAKAAFGQRTYGDVASNVSTDSAGTTIGGQLSLSFTEVVKVDHTMLTSILTPAGPLEIENPDEVTSPTGETFAEGALTLDPDQVADYLASEDASGSEVAKLDRAQLVWTAWLLRVDEAKNTPGIVPGEAEAGLGRFVRGLAAGSVDYGTLPVVEADPIGDVTTFRLDEPLARLMLTNAIPFPVAGGGERLTVRLLNGTGAGPIPQSVMQRLVFGGAQVTVIGNNASFDVQTTTFTYSAAAKGTLVKTMAEALGRGKVVLKPEEDTGADVTVILGRDVIGSSPPILSPDEIEP